MRFVIRGILSVTIITLTVWLFTGASNHSTKTISNGQLTIRVNELGAELNSIVANATGHEYLWQADPAFWKRQSPVLFPIVGSLWENEFRHAGKTYTLPLHGFARDRAFQLVVDEPSEIRYRLESDDETLRVYPFPFCLEIGYRLKNNRVEVLWSVKNTGKDTMYFQIGAHPGFNYPDYRAEEKEHGYFALGSNTLNYRLIGDKGCVDPKRYTMQLEEGLLPLDMHTFDQDALIIEDGQLKTIELLDRKRNPYLSLHFNAPVVGLWSPPGKNAPFVCIEPWFGRCDRMEYTGEYKDRDWMQALEPRGIFEASYVIEVAIK